MRNLLYVVILCCASLRAQDKNGTFSVTNGIKCNRTLSVENRVTEKITGKYRIISANAIPDHKVGQFPNPGNPNRISEQKKKYKIPLNPKKGKKLIPVSADGFGKGFPAYEFGVALNGVKLEPTAAEFFGGRGPNTNTNWVLEALSTKVNLGDDCNNAHVQPTGEYHYHGTPWEYIKQLPRKSMQQVGWAADGFPIYYKYGFENPMDSNSKLIELVSSYQLKNGKRPGNGISSPNGNYDGTYVRDFEYIEGLGQLDKANGRFGVTPEFPKGTYYYVITDDFPSLPRFFVGTPSKDFATAGGMLMGRRGRDRNNRFGDRRGGNQMNGQRPQRPSAKQLIKMMDADGDGKLSKDEVKGPLLEDFDRVDANEDGFLTLKEIQKAAPKDSKPQQRNNFSRGGRRF